MHPQALYKSFNTADGLGSDFIAIIFLLPVEISKETGMSITLYFVS